MKIVVTIFTWTYKMVRMKRPFDLFTPLLFLYFVTLHADQLSIRLGGMSFRLNNAIALLLFALLLARYAKKLFYFDRSLLFGLGVITLSMALSFLFSLHKLRSFYFIIWWGFTLTLYILLPYLLVQCIGMQKVLTLYLISFVAVGLYALLQLTFSCCGLVDPFASQFVIQEKIVRANAFTYEPSYYALYMTPFVMMANLHYILKEKSAFACFSQLKLHHILFINFLFVLSTSTSTLFAYLAFFVLFISFSYLTKAFYSFTKFLLSFALSLGALMVSLPFLAKGFFLKFFYTGFIYHHSFVERFTGILNGFQLFLEHPITGVGMGAYPLVLLEKYVSADSRYIFYLQKMGEDMESSIKIFEPTNVTTEIAASLGIVGVLAFLLFFGLFFLRFRAAWKVTSEKNRALTFFIPTLVMLFVLQFNQGLFRTYIWTHLALSWAYFDSLVPREGFCKALV